MPTPVKLLLFISFSFMLFYFISSNISSNITYIFLYILICAYSYNIYIINSNMYITYIFFLWLRGSCKLLYHTFKFFSTGFLVSRMPMRVR